MRHALVKLEAEVIAASRGAAVNRSLARRSLSPSGKNRTEPCSFALKRASTSGGEGNQQGHRKHRIHLRTVRYRRRSTHERRLPQPLSGLSVFQAPRCAARRPGGDLSGTDGTDRAGALVEEGMDRHPPMPGLQRHPPQPAGRRSRAARCDRGSDPACRPEYRSIGIVVEAGADLPQRTPTAREGSKTRSL
jgi:hypothetical protein